MKRIKAIHIDDEQDSLDVMRILLEEHCKNVRLVGTANNVKEGIQLIKETEPHLVFLDVEMPGSDGFSLLEAIENKSFHTIMVTGYSEYALKAIKYSAIDYLMKPLDKDELKSAVMKLDPERITTDPRLAHLGKLLKQETVTYEKLMIPTDNGYKNIAIGSIMYAVASKGNYSIFYMENGNKEVVSKSLSYFESLLPAESFFRIHRSHIVNLKKVKEYNYTSSLVILSNDVELLVATRKKANFRKKIQM